MRVSMKAGMYVRVSTEKQETENQEGQLRALCQARGWEISRVYRDVLSGAAPGRQAFHDLMHDARVGKIRVIVFWAWDRITREGISAAFEIMQRWEGWNVAWESLREPFLSSSSSDPSTRKLLLAMIAWTAEQERIHLSERVKASVAQRRALGVPVGRKKGAKDRKQRIRRWRRKPIMAAEESHSLG